jgi:hypothetical protein
MKTHLTRLLVWISLLAVVFQAASAVRTGVDAALAEAEAFDAGFNRLARPPRVIMRNNSVMIGVDLNNVSVLINGTNCLMSNCVSRIDSPAIDYAP